MIKLYKHCEAKHNIAKKGTTIRLGTFEYYRDKYKDAERYADRYEGYRESKLRAGGTPFQLTQEMVHSTLTLECPQTINGQYNENTTLQNCYMFCCSLSSSMAFSDCDSYYSLPTPEIIGKIIGETLIAELGRNDVEIRIEHSAIKYFDNDAFNKDVAEIEQWLENTRHPIQFAKFKKDSNTNYNYENEKEYRFLFLIIDKQTGKQIAVDKNPKDLKIPRNIRRVYFK